MYPLRAGKARSIRGAASPRAAIRAHLCRSLAMRLPYREAHNTAMDSSTSYFPSSFRTGSEKEAVTCLGRGRCLATM